MFQNNTPFYYNVILMLLKHYLNLNLIIMIDNIIT